MDLIPSRKELVTKKVNEALERTPYGSAKITGIYCLGSLISLFTLRTLLALSGAQVFISSTTGVVIQILLVALGLGASITIGRKHFRRTTMDAINMEHLDRPRLEDQQLAERRTENIIFAAKKRITLLEQRIENLRRLGAQADELAEKYKEEGGLQKQIKDALKPQKDRVSDKVTETKNLIIRLKEQMAHAETCLFTIAVNAEFENINQNPCGGSHTEDSEFEEHIARALDELKAIACEIDEDE